jgi:predicted unusual protein kinase regulating ubiquinone biosynthesis (AarF/ABC1/UbiB family)
VTDPDHDALGDVEVDGRLLGRAARIARVLASHGLQERRSTETDDPMRARARRLRSALEELGPTFAKLGQIISTRPDLVPPEVAEELSSLQDRMPPLTEAEVVAVMEEELGVPWEDVFDHIDPEPLAAGTIGQVHRAVLEDGDRVVIKVQRPTARDEILRDLGLLELFAQKAARRETLRDLVDLEAMVDHLAESLRNELDFTVEAANVEKMRVVLEPYPRLEVPGLYPELSTSRLLVLEEVQGVPIYKAEAGTARTDAARQLLESYYRQVLWEGFFHADPHPGNLMWWDGRIFFLDFGMVGEIGPELREQILLLLLAFWREDAHFLAEVVLMLSGDEGNSEVDLDALSADFTEFVGRFRHGSLRDLELGPMLEGLTDISARHGVRLPASLALTGKAFAQMQLAVAELDPTLDPFAPVSGFLVRTIRTQVREGANPQRIFYEAHKTKLRITRLISSFERVIGARPGARLQVQFRGIEPLEETMRSSARRVALGLTAGSALIATGVTAASEHVASWVPITFGGVAAALTGGLLVDLFRGRGRA